METASTITPPPESIKSKPKPREIKIGATQHFPDFLGMDRNEMGKVCDRIIEAGADTLRFDFRWRNVIDERRQLIPQGQKHYIEALKVMREKGFSQIMVISDPPKYVKDLARKGDIEGYERELRRYLDIVQDAYKQAGISQEEARSPSTIQVFNELNFRIYNDWIHLDNMNKESQFDLPQLNKTLDLVREYFPHSSRSINMIVSNLVTGLEKVSRGISAPRYLEELLKVCGDKFEEVGLDYYPGLYNLDSLSLKKMWTNMDPLIQILDWAADRRTPLGKKAVSISEFGSLSELKIPGLGRLLSEKTQRGFYVYFIREIYRLMRVYDSRAQTDSHLRQPISSLVCYQAQDEFDESIPEPMRHFGVFTTTGEKKGYQTKTGKMRYTVDSLRRIFNLKGLPPLQPAPSEKY